MIPDSAMRMTITRYVDDMMLYAKSLDELVYMSETLIEELARMGFKLNTKKTKIFRLELDTPHVDSAFVAINDDLVEILATDAAYRYLGRKLTTCI